MADFFEEKLLACSWRGIVFPIAHFRAHISHDIAEHKRPDQDGARVEATGRNPIRFSGTALFRNHIAPGRGEVFSDALYPGVWFKFIAAMSDRTTGVLQHPSLGSVSCKPVSAETVLEAGKRDGEDVACEWIECTPTEDQSNAFFRGDPAIESAPLDGGEIDTYLSTNHFEAFDPDADKISLEEAMRRIKGVFDTASLLSRQVFGLIDRVVYRLDAIDESIRELQDPQNWPAKQAIARLRASLERIKRDALKAQRDVKFFIVPTDTTLAAVASRVRNTVSDLVRLNPTLVGTPRLTRGTPIRYFAVAA